MKERKRDRESIGSLPARWKLQSYHIVMEIISHHLCHILLVRSNQKSCLYSKGVGLCKAVATRGRDHSDPLTAYLQQVFVCGRATSHQEALRVHCGFWMD